uniref:Methyl transferase and helicase n=1 Tax=Austropuccinia psidii associated ssRNA virus 1 TaxID=3180356 RepID=A0AAU7YRT5_9VIRU
MSYMWAEEIVEVAASYATARGLSKDECAKFLNAQLDVPDSAIRSRYATYSAERNLAMKKYAATKIELSHSGILSADEQAIVKKNHPDFVVKFPNQQARPHSLAACMRKIDRVILKKRAPFNAKLVSIGGDYTYEVPACTQGEVVHCCTPAGINAVDAKDATREVRRQAKMRRMLKDPDAPADVKDRVRDFFDGGQKWRCSNMTQHCKVPADILMSCHVYDMTLENYVAAMSAHNAKLVFGAMLYHPDMEIKSRGKLDSVAGFWERDGNKIKFGFDHEGQWLYEHDWNEYRRFGFNHQLVTSLGQSASYSIWEKRGDTIYFVMKFGIKDYIKADSPAKLHWRSSGNRFIVNGYKYDPRPGVSGSSHLAPEVFSYPAEPFKRALAYALQKIEKGSFNLTDMAAKSRTLFADVTVNAVRISGGEHLDDEDKAYFFANVGLVAHKLHLESKNSEKLLLQSAMVNRELATSSLTHKILAAAKALVASPFAGESSGNKWYQTARKVIVSMAAFHLDTVSWYEDSGYKSAELLTAPGRILDYEEGGDDYAAANTFQTLLSAASGDLEFRLMLARASANIMPCAPMREQADKLMREFSLQQNEHARKADAAEAKWRDMPDVTNVSSGSTTTKVDSREKAVAQGLHLDISDTVVEHHVTHEQWEKYSEAAITEAQDLLEAEQRHILGECAKNYNQTTRETADGVQPCKTLIHNEGKLNFEVDYWSVSDGVLPERSLTGKPGNENNFFPYGGVYIASDDYVAEVERKRIDQKMVFVVRDRRGKLYSGWVMTTSNLVIFNGPEVLRKLQMAKEKMLPPDFALDFVEGVPGCGKTHYIINCVPPDGVVIAVTRESANDTRRRIEERNETFSTEPGFNPMRNTERRVRTLDSMLKFMYTDKVSALFFDECFQEHAGKIMACIKLLGVNRVQVLGDRGQIPYFSRIPGFSCIMARLSTWRLHVTKFVTRRCPRDATVAISEFYDGKIRTVSTVAVSLATKFDITPTNVPKLESYKYLVMYQDEKHDLTKQGFRDVNTVGEVQGQTYERVALVRLAPKPKQLFDSPEQVDVALSRHTKEFVYMAPNSAPDTLIERVMAKAKAMPNVFDRFADVTSAGVDLFSL